MAAGHVAIERWRLRGLRRRIGRLNIGRRRLRDLRWRIGRLNARVDDRVAIVKNERAVNF